MLGWLKHKFEKTLEIDMSSVLNTLCSNIIHVQRSSITRMLSYAQTELHNELNINGYMKFYVLPKTTASLSEININGKLF